MQMLEVVDGQGRRRHIPLDRPRFLIGREPSCNVHLPHPGVSRRHAQLQCTDQGRWVLQDLSSRNHTYVDNRPIQQIFLEPRKPFRIADYHLSLIDSPAPPTPELELQDDTADTSPGLDNPWIDSLHTFQRGLVPIDDPAQVLEFLAGEVRRAFRPKVQAIGLAKPSGYTWEIVQAEQEDFPLNNSLKEADEKVSEEASSVVAWVSKSQAESTPQSFLVPLKGRQGVLGHVYVAQPSATPMTRAMLRYLGLIASYAGLTFENLQLSRHRQVQIEMEKELQHARTIQLGLFPPTFEVDARLDAYAVNLPSTKVSGDYYDLFRIGPDVVAFVIADAMGHGMPAALLMAAVRAGLRMGLSLQLPWPSVFQGVDDLIRQARADTFVTGMVGALNLRDHELLLVSAGHPSPSIFVDGQSVPVPDACMTRPWGIDLETPWEVSRLCLKGKRWSIICYTDGVTDAAVRQQRSLAASRMARFHEKSFDLTAEDLCQSLLTEFAAPAAGSLPDDQTVLVLCSMSP
ncbi:MAG: SpoIIE family protein phosphatase [Gemmataceae bacterium]|nr:SpoIIE family protein phosphatase [Gemmataceae bacterium]